MSSQTMRKRNIAIIGYGSIGRKHAKIISENKHFNLSAIIDPLVPYHPPEECLHFSTFEELIGSGLDIDILAVCTPNGAHANHAIKGLKAGMHVVVEKPLALTKKSAEEILHTAFNTSKKVFCVMQLRYSPVAIWLKEIVQNNRLGDINTVDIRCYWNRNEQYYDPESYGGDWRGKMEMDGGPLFTQFSHFVDLIYWLLGEWEVKHGLFNNYSHKDLTEFEDTGSIQFCIGQILGHFMYTTATYDKNYESTVTILGSKGTVAIGGQYFDNILYCKPDHLRVEDTEIKQYAKDKIYGHRMIYENIRSVLSSGESITTNALDGMKVVEMIEKVYKRRK